MARFVDRKDELVTLSRLANDTRPHFLIVFGRRVARHFSWSLPPVVDYRRSIG